MNDFADPAAPGPEEDTPLEDGAVAPPLDDTILALPPGRGREHGKGREILVDAMVHDIALRALNGQTMREIAMIHGMTPRNVQHILNTPEARRIYVKERERIVADVEGAIKNEKIPSVVRRSALVTRAETALGEIISAVRDQINMGNPKASILRAGVDAVNSAFNHSEVAGQGSGRNVPAVHISLTADKAALIQTVMHESEVDLSDVIEGYSKTQEED